MYEFNKKQFAKLERLREDDIEPYPVGQDGLEPIETLVSFGEELTNEELDSFTGEFTIAGRLRFKNALGKIGFGRIQQAGSKIQICVKKQVTDPDSFAAFKRLDVGDWVCARGTLFRTRTGELTLLAENLYLYSKCIEGMPDKHTGLTNPETRQRMRYLDLMVNDETMTTFVHRNRIIRYIRNYLEYAGFMEVETPVLQTIPGGASAKPFITRHNTLHMDMYMRVAPELYLKRLLVGGFEKVFEIGKNFRNEGISTKHNPEFTMVEFYQAHATYEDLMNFTTKMVSDMVNFICGKRKITYGDMEIDFDNWRVVEYSLLLQVVGVEDPWSLESLQQTWRDKTGDEPPSNNVSEMQSLIFDNFVEERLVDPVFVTHYPAEISPLARRNDDDPRVTDRFELFIGRQEIANGFTELNDPVDQAARFSRQAELKSQGDEEAMYFDSDYIRALSYGMPPAAGEGIGIDRLVMLLTNSQSIRDVILFPTLKERNE